MSQRQVNTNYNTHTHTHTPHQNKQHTKQRWRESEKRQRSAKLSAAPHNFPKRPKTVPQTHTYTAVCTQSNGHKHGAVTASRRMARRGTAHSPPPALPPCSGFRASGECGTGTTASPGPVPPVHTPASSWGALQLLEILGNGAARKQGCFSSCRICLVLKHP